METPLLQGSVHKAPRRNKSQAHDGIQPLSPLIHRTQRFQPLPLPIGNPPYHYDLKNAIPNIEEITNNAKKLVFHTVGDVGGIKTPEYQDAVVQAMKNDLSDLEVNDRPLFFYLLGDVVYYNGEMNEYYNQFYEPYNHYDVPILSIPGNHDGDPIDATQISLDGWTRYFMTKEPHVDPLSKDAPRVTICLPNVYHTTIAPYATIVGLYSNVPEHGSIDSQQLQWLTNELYTAPADKALILAIHHPIYSFDQFHSGSANMADVVEHAINESRRVPNLVLMGHVHNYQRIEKEIAKNSKTPFLVAGNGGYYNLHHLSTEVGNTDTETNATLIYGDDKQHGYLTISVDSESISGYATLIDKSQVVTKKADEFTYTAKALFLEDGQNVKL